MNTSGNDTPNFMDKQLSALERSNELLCKRQNELEQKLQEQLQLCERLKKRLREIGSQNRSINAERGNHLREIADMSRIIEKAHEKIFNTAFTAGVITREVMELLNSQSFVWTNFLRYTRRTLLNFSLQGKFHFLRTVLGRILLHKKMQLPSALQGVDRELKLLNAALSELCKEVNLNANLFSAGITLAKNGEEAVTAPPFEAVTQWKQILSSHFGKKLSKQVIISTLLFYDADGKNYMHGGAERYVVELFGILKELGYDAVVVQAGHSNWKLMHKCSYGMLPVVALQSELVFDRFSAVMNEYVEENPCMLVIYSPFLIASPYAAVNSIGISHGIFWDDWHYHRNQETTIFHQNTIRQAFANCHDIVSVDTNTINWFRTMTNDAEINLSYIPNFVDKQEFHPQKNRNCAEIDKIRIVYPRRLYAARGFNLLLEAFPALFDEYPNIELALVGQIDASSENALKKFLASYPERIRHQCCPPEKMPEIYRNADIVLVPTCYSEGTSLSCLEAMASGCAVIATNVGGLPELIINHFNGLLIAPNAKELFNAVKTLLDSPCLRKELARHAVETSDCYKISIWREAWKRILQKKLVFNITPAIEFVQLAAPGMTWNAMKQRPQQLFQALAESGYDATYISDEPEINQALIRDIPSRLHIHPASFIPQLNGKYLYLYFPNIIYHRNFTYGELIKRSDCKIIFDILDDPSIHTNPETGKPDQVFMNNFNLLLEKSDFVITSARQLFEKYHKIRPDMELVFNGVNIEDFYLKVPPKRPEDLPNNGRPVIGYYGALAQWVDFDLIFLAAQTLKNFDFVLIGLNVNEEEIARVTALENVHFLGIKHYDSLADYLWYFDVATIPFKINPVTNAASPIKLFEYCASGTPVVTTNFTEVRQYESLGIQVACSNDDYIAKLKYAAGLKGEELQKMQERLRNIAFCNTWTKRAQIITDMIKKHEKKEQPTIVAQKEIPYV